MAATKDVFGRTAIHGGSMAADTTRMGFTGFNSSGLIIQQLTIGYNQSVTRLYALEDGKVYFVAGRTDGQMDVQHVIGPAGLQKAFFEQYGDVCNVNKVIVISLAAGCGGNVGKSKIQINNPVITSINMQVNSNDMIIGSGLRLIFTSLGITETAGIGTL